MKDIIKKITESTELKAVERNESQRNLILNLIETSELSEAPQKKTMQGKWISVLIAIGNDHTAELLLTFEALEELKRLDEIDMEKYRTKQ